jgi:hypothetical protein
MDHLFDFTSAVTKEFFRLVTQEGVTSYDEDELAMLALKNVLAEQGLTVIGSGHYKEILNNYWLDEPDVLRSIRDNFTRYNAEAPPEADRAALAMRAIADALSKRNAKVVRAPHYEALLSSRVLPSPQILAKIVDRYNKIKAESPGVNHHTLAMDAIEHVLAKHDRSVMHSDDLAKLNELAERELIAPSITVVPKDVLVVITKEGTVRTEPDGAVIIRDYRKGADCMACEGYFFFEDMRITYRLDKRGNSAAHSRKHVCLDCVVAAKDSIPF